MSCLLSSPSGSFCLYGSFYFVCVCHFVGSLGKVCVFNPPGQLKAKVMHLRLTYSVQMFSFLKKFFFPLMIE